MAFDVKKRMADMQSEWNKLTGVEPSVPALGQTFEGMTIGDVFEWSDAFVEADYPNTLYLTTEGHLIHRRLTGQLVHMHGHPRWGFGLRMRLLCVPEGDPLKVGEEVFRWGDRLKWNGKIKRLGG